MQNALLVFLAFLMVALTGATQTASATPQTATTTIVTTATSLEKAASSLVSTMEVQSTKTEAQTIPLTTGFATCDKPIFIGGRGSGETNPGNMGQTIYDTYKEFASIMGESNITPYALEYPAVKITKENLSGLFTKDGDKTLKNSILAGAKAFVKKLSSLQLECKGKQRVGIAVYSQASLAFTDALKSINAQATKKCLPGAVECVKVRDHAKGILKGIVGVVRIAHPTLWVGNTVSPNIPGIAVEKRKNYCLDGDPLCHWNATKAGNCWELKPDCPHFWYSNKLARENGAEAIDGKPAACHAGQWLAGRFGKKSSNCHDSSPKHPTPTPEPNPGPGKITIQEVFTRDVQGVRTNSFDCSGPQTIQFGARFNNTFTGATMVKITVTVFGQEYSRSERFDTGVRSDVESINVPASNVGAKTFKFQIEYSGGPIAEKEGHFTCT